jgi:hypothetical protein
MQSVLTPPMTEARRPANPREFMAAVGKYTEELQKAGVLVDMAGLKPTSSGAKLRYRAGQLKVVDGPFAEAKEVIAGYWILKVSSKAEAIEWVKRFPFEAGGPQEGEGEVEIREFFEFDELPQPSDQRK